MTKKVQSLNYGFTLIELLIVFSIIGILSVKGIAALADYSRSQALNTAVLDLVTTLQQARNRSASQVKPDICGTLDGYKIGLCSRDATSCAATDGSYSYAMYAVCGNNTVFIDGKKFPTNISYDNATSTNSILFRVITGGVIGNGTIKINGYNSQSKTITIDSVGNVSGY